MDTVSPHGHGYDKTLQIGALFGMLAVSSLSALLPLAVSLRQAHNRREDSTTSTSTPTSNGNHEPGYGFKHSLELHVPDEETTVFLFWIKHIGSGVILALGFMHLLPTAFENLLDPAVTETYNLPLDAAFPGLLSLISIFVIATVEQVFTELGGNMHAHAHGIPEEPEAEEQGTADHESEEIACDQRSAHSQPQADRSTTLKCVLLETGILFHSIFIGMALSVTRQPAFIPFFIAILFHQALEGLSLGARIALLPIRIASRLFMCVGYGLTLPLGQAIGLILLYSGGSYDPDDPSSLLLVGCMNAISAGLLLWSALVQLIAADFLGSARKHGIMGRGPAWRWSAWVAVALGAAAMGVIANWA